MKRKTISRRSGTIAATIAAATLSAALVATPPQAAAMLAEDEGADILIFPDGKQLIGKILEETETTVLFEGEVAGIPLKTTYKKTELLAIRRNQAPDAGSGDPDMASTATPKEAPAAADDTPPDPNATRVYVLTLEGEFKSEIHVEPIRRALKDARKLEPDYLVVVVNNDWADPQIDDSDNVQVVTAFDELFYAEEIEPLFTSEIRDSWDKKPEIVFWVKNAMGGAAFLPFVSKTIYFDPDGRIGGIGGLQDQFGGEEAYNEKQISLRIGHAEGMLIARGYEPKLVRAFARTPYVLSYKLEGGKPIYIEAMPTEPDEVLLTDDGEGDNADTIQQVVRKETNDNLTLYAEPARQIGVSKGTVASLDDLLFELGIATNSEVLEGSGERIMENWRRGLETARRELPRMWDDYNQIQGNDPNKVRGQQISQLRDIIKLIRKFDGALVPQQYGVPPVPELEALIAQLRLDALGDRG